MIFFLVALAVILHVGFWGTGLAVLVMPRRWRRFWPVAVFPAGLALQSAVVWAAAVSGMRGTDAYAWPALLLPLVLFFVALRRTGADILRRDARRMGAVWVMTAVALVLLVLPLALGVSGLTSVSLGSCDAADYAAGARVLMEFSRADRTGFLGLTEVVRVQSVDNFFDYWLRLNHFTPAALIALNGTVVDCRPHELTTILTMVLVATSVPIAFWLARAVVGLRPGASVGVGLLYGVSPVTWYAAAQVAPGQLLAAQAIGLITWAGVASWRDRAGRRSRWGFFGVLAIAYWLVLGSYNFILLVCWVPAAAYAGGSALVRGEWRALARWGVGMLAPLAACSVVFFGRAAGLAERFTLLRTYDFGWPIAALTPEGWLGFIDRAPALQGMAIAWRVVLSAAFGAAVVIAVWRAPRRRWTVVSLAGPALVGYAYLVWRAAALGTNASYDAYKLLAVFFPGILAASLVWLRGGTMPPAGRLAVAVLAALVALAHLRSLSQWHHALKSPPLRVTFDLRDVRKIEAMPDVPSLNVLIPDMWSRLWANALLLRKPQYFATHTYEARLNTELKGEWDLLGGIAGVQLPDNRSRRVNDSYTLVRRASPNFVRVGLGAGWHAEEMEPASGARWRWSAERPEVIVENPQPHAVRATLLLDAQSVVARDVAAVIDGRRSAAVKLPADVRTVVELGGFELRPGRTVIALESPQPLARVAGDPRPLGWSARRIEVRVLGR